MKLSISLPTKIAKEIRLIANKTERSMSWWVQKAWETSRVQLIHSSKAEEIRQKRALQLLHQLRGTLKKDFPETSSVALVHQAFSKDHL